MDTDNMPKNINVPSSPVVGGKLRPKVLIPVVILVLAGLGGMLFTRTWQEDTREQPPAVTTTNESDDEQTEVEVQITKDGFVPSTITIAKGTKVTWTNLDTSPHRVAANPYPDHTELPSLDSKEALGPDTTYTYTFNESGTFGYHDHYQPTTNGTVIVE